MAGQQVFAAADTADVADEDAESAGPIDTRPGRGRGDGDGGEGRGVH